MNIDIIESVEFDWYEVKEGQPRKGVAHVKFINGQVLSRPVKEKADVLELMEVDDEH